MGEVNVVEKMKQNNAVIGGEGNGGVIFPASHYGRDALGGIALFLSHLCTWKDGGQRMSDMKRSYPEYFMSKNKIELEEGMDVQGILDQLLTSIQLKLRTSMMDLKLILKRNGYIYENQIQSP